MNTLEINCTSIKKYLQIRQNKATFLKKMRLVRAVTVLIHKLCSHVLPTDFAYMISFNLKNRKGHIKL